VTPQSMLEQQQTIDDTSVHASGSKGHRSTGATLVPHGSSAADLVDDQPDSELLEPMGVEVVSPEGIEPSTNRLRVCCSAS
jgi:hypothetical protein